MKPVTCIITEDEKPAQRVLASYIAQIPGLTLVNTFSNALEAMQFLQHEPVDLLFLDIRMPGMSGLEFLEAVEKKPAVIMTTAYGQYALDGFEHGVVDYLVKPFSFARFCKAVNRYAAIAGRKGLQDGVFAGNNDIRGESLMVKTDGGETEVFFSDILVVEAYGNYLRIRCTDQHLIIRETLTGFLNKLPPGRFLRVHRSWVVATGKITRFSGHLLQIGELTVPVGNLYKAGLRDALGMDDSRSC